MKTLRPYQAAALNSLWEYIKKVGKHALVVAPVGAGKSLMIADFIRQCHQLFAGTRVIMVTHDKRLLEQNMAELREQYPGVNAGFYCAGLGEKRLHNDVTFASIQSIYKKAALLNRAPNVILIDEVHLVPHNTDTQYRKFIDDCLELNPKLKVVGFTGTPFRADSGHLCQGDDRLFDDICYDIPIGFLIDEGYLCRPTVPRVDTHLSTDGVGTSKGDYIPGQLAEAVNTNDNNRECVREIIQHGQSRHRWLVFTVNIEHCEDVVAEFKEQGVDAVAIHSKIPKAEAAKIIEDYKAGEIKCLVNVAMLTTGFNSPEIDLLAFMRPTRSPVLYIQTMGRGIRTVYANGYDLSTKEGRLSAIAASQKKDCLVLDFGHVIDELGPIDAIEVTKTHKRKEELDIELDEEPEDTLKFCPKCQAAAQRPQRVCYECGYEFFEPPQLAAKAAANRQILSTDEAEVQEVAVWDMHINKHRRRTKEGDPPATPVMRVTYETPLGNVNEWVCFEHTGVALTKAKAWHSAHMPCLAFSYPPTIDFAIECHTNGNRRNRYSMPKKIKVIKSGKYYNVVSKELPSIEEVEAAYQAEEQNLNQNEEFDF